LLNRSLTSVFDFKISIDIYYIIDFATSLKASN